MAGMEELEIHSKSYLVRWVNVKGEHTISWSIQPHKKSINFGLFKHPGHGVSLTPNLPATPPLDPPGTPRLELSEPQRDASTARDTHSTLVDKLKSIGLKPTLWVGKCEADKISQGKYDVPANEGGMFGLVFDNTFSKQISKTATFALCTYPTNTPPQSGHHIHHSQATTINTSSPRPSPRLGPLSRDSSDSLKKIGFGRRSVSTPNGRLQQQSSDTSGSVPTTVHTGVLQKRRRKRHQGYARRFFSLDFTSSTLSYYHDRNSSALRGAIPLSLAAIGTNESSREISIDSGAEIWHLRSSNSSEFEAWKNALEKAAKTVADAASPRDGLKVHTQTLQPGGVDVAEERDWARVEALVGRVAGTADAVRRLAKDTDPKFFSAPTPAIVTAPSNQTPSPTESSGEEILKWEDKRPFWKRKASGSTTPTLFKRSVSSQLGLPIPTSEPAIQNGKVRPPQIPITTRHEEGMHDHCMALLRDLDTVVAEFSGLIAESKQRRLPVPKSAVSRVSVDSETSQEFFDADDGNLSSLLTIQRDSEDEGERTEGELTADDDSLSSSDVEETGSYVRKGFRLDSTSTSFPSKSKSLAPLPISIVPRRTTIPGPLMMPPSLIGILRKNVGKDLSTITMPVSANEPISLLQRAAEQVEYSGLLEKAAAATDGVERLIYVTSFAISSLSSARVKERSIRKPFNPMLGETYEMVREDHGIRFVAEKVSHHPVQLAFQVEAKDWTFAQSPKPSQKFWGKSAEIVTDGKARLILHTHGECFSWSAPTSLIRNLIAGEKYVEPVGVMAVVNESTGQKAIVTFKAKGMFSGRSEDVSAQVFDTHGEELPLGLHGTWTNSLQLTEHGTLTTKTIWAAGALVDQAPKRYGFTSFAASLNEITEIEKDKLPPTDSRLRPDQRAYEDGDLDTAEEFKAQLEERQRVRRKELETRGESWRPRWFSPVEFGDEVIWKLKTGKEGYWEERVKGEWTGLVPVFKL